MRRTPLTGSFPARADGCDANFEMLETLQLTVKTFQRVDCNGFPIKRALGTYGKAASEEASLNRESTTPEGEALALDCLVHAVALIKTGTR